MHKEVDSIIEKINSSFQTRDLTSLSLFSGETGCCIFDKLYIDYARKDDFEKFQNNVAMLAENSLSISFPSFCNGKSGINWFFAYLNKLDMLSNEDFELLCDDDSDLAGAALLYLQKEKYDFIHGATGIAYHLLYSRGKTFQGFFDDFFKSLKALIKVQDGKYFIFDFDLLKDTPIKNQVNLGLAHGLPSIVKFCLQCYKQNICTEDAKLIALELIDFIKSTTNKNGSLSAFPTQVNIEESKTELGTSRLAWCYGDLGIAIILYQAAITFHDNDLELYALDILLNSTQRKIFTETMVYDAAFCHGAAGIAHIYNKIWHYTQNTKFKTACDFWIRQTINQATYEDGIGGFKVYHHQSKTHINSHSLLEGTCGIGLVLLSYATGDFSWDYCLMLND